MSDIEKSSKFYKFNCKKCRKLQTLAYSRVGQCCEHKCKSCGYKTRVVPNIDDCLNCSRMVACLATHQVTLKEGLRVYEHKIKSSEIRLDDLQRSGYAEIKKGCELHKLMAKIWNSERGTWYYGNYRRRIPKPPYYIQKGLVYGLLTIAAGSTSSVRLTSAGRRAIEFLEDSTAPIGCNVRVPIEPSEIYAAKFRGSNW